MPCHFSQKMRPLDVIYWKCLEGTFGKCPLHGMCTKCDSKFQTQVDGRSVGESSSRFSAIDIDMPWILLGSSNVLVE
jgi:hypothetical protein